MIMTSLIQISLLVISFIRTTHASDLCLCNTYTSSYVQSRRLTKKDKVSFHDHKDLNMKGNYGEQYIRPNASRRLSSQEVHRLAKSYGNKNHNGYCNSDQIHVSLGDDDTSLVITYASVNTDTDSSVQFSTSIDSFNSNTATTAIGYPTSYSEVMDLSSDLWDPEMGAPSSTDDEIATIENTATWAYSIIDGNKEEWANYNSVKSADSGYQDYDNPYVVYSSPVIHRVVLNDLTPGTIYYYAVSGSCDIYETSIPVLGKYPMTVGLTVDLGQTDVSYASMAALEVLNPDVILLPGDLSYADGYPSLWDTWGNLMQSLSSKIPILTTTGNHEVVSGENSVSHTIRYPTPFRGSGSTNPCYYGKTVGVMNVIALCSYSGITPDSLQYQWFENYLSTSIDRDLTPWVVVIMHSPFYNSNNGKWMVAELMRQQFEPLMYQYGVDIVLDGHVHVYERSHPVYDNIVNPCGATYLNLGDGGNYHGTSTDWRTAPTWSAFREASFGIGELLIENSTHIRYSWHRHACQSDSPGAPDYNMDFSLTCKTDGDDSAQAMIAVDTAYITRPTICHNRYMSTSKSARTKGVNSATSVSNTDSIVSKGYGLSFLEKGLILLTVVLFVTIVGLLIALIKIHRRSNRSNSDYNKLSTSILSIDETSYAVLYDNKI